MKSRRFSGRIAGFGTASGTRIVVGMWESGPLGRFGDVMLEQADGHRILFAPSDEVATFVSETYTFDEVRRVPVTWRRIDGGLAVDAGELRIRMRIGGISPLGRLLRAVPRAFATHPLWLRAIDPLARVLQPGARTAGSAGNGRREYYGVTDARRIVGVSVRRGDDSLGGLTRLHPPVRFGFGSAPAAPHLVDVTTTILLPATHA
ncbi:hypothetical protein HQQ80_12165 [Microbacteriaceae bacterium VKM Ac-2855]|nr:hypothetical protein [Microbacteriaceae bacterium VKM Ac-2855]